MTATCATAITVAYRTTSLAVGWVPEDAPIVVVHNDHELDNANVAHLDVLHIGDGVNIGFGAAVNHALAHVRTERTVLFNPDTVLEPAHWDALSEGGPHELVVLPLVDNDGHLTSMVNRYPTPASALLTALRVGRWLPRHHALHRTLLPLLGRWGRDHADSLTSTDGSGSWPASTHWACAAACSYPTELLRAVGGFDPDYFLYLEDVDVTRRMAAADPALRIVQPDVSPGRHAVSASSRDADTRCRANLEQARSAARYASGEQGYTWKVVAATASAVAAWRRRAT
jgi:hypothetical protein